MKNEKLTNIDLDVVSILNNFPEDETHSVIYVSCIIDNGNDTTEAFIKAYGTPEMLTNVMYALLDQDGENGEILRGAIFDSVIDYLEYNKQYLSEFKGFLNEIK